MAYKDLNKKREYQRNWYRKRKEAFLRFKWCVRCGDVDNLELDHIDPRTKSFEIKWSYSWAKLKPELDKCQVLCSTCHKIKSDYEMGHVYDSNFQPKVIRADIFQPPLWFALDSNVPETVQIP